jgi:integrase
MQSHGSQLRVRVERGIYRRKTRDGKTTRYEIAYLDSDGRQRWRTVGTLREARDLRADLVSKVNRGERVAPSRVTLRDAGDQWLSGQTARIRASTHTRYRISLEQHVYPRLGRLRLGDVTVNDVARLVAELEREGKAGWTIRGVLVAMGRVLAAAEREGQIASNPVRKLERGERPRVRRTEFPSLDREAIGRLITHSPDKYRTLIAVSVLTGIRQSEALGLQWHDVDTRTGVIRIRRQLDRDGTLADPKTDSAKRDVPIPPSLASMLNRHREAAFASGHARATDFVFASEEGTPLGHHNIGRRGLDKAAKAAGLPRLRWHDLRHIAASVLIAQGSPASYVANVLGHASPAITLGVYAHLFAKAEHADRTRDRMEAAFGELLR